MRYKGNLKNGKRVGNWVSYWDDGKLRYKGDYKKSKQEGSWIHFKKDGTLLKKLSGTFKDGKKISD